MKRLAAKRRHALRRFVCGLILAPLVTQGSFATAQVTGGTVVAGQASIAQDGATTNIDTFSDRTIINWQGFSLDAGQIGGDVVNEGIITTSGGSISLATGGSVTLAE